MINYIVQVLLFQAVFLAVYDLVLKKETFFQWNRAFLIVSSFFAYLLPLLKFKTVSDNLPQEYIIMLPEVMLSPASYIEKQIDWSSVLFTSLQWIFFIGLVLSALLFIYKLLQIIKLIVKNESEKKEEYSLVLLSKENTSFSFFKYIFLGKSLIEREKIIEHELIHVKQKHSLDLLFFEMQKIVFWFNPFSYLFQNRVAEVHEFIADAKTVNKKEKSTFYHSLLAQTFAVDKIAFVNAFNKQSLVKKRIIMFSKKKSKEFLKFKYLLLIPILLGMLVYTSCGSINNKNELRDIKIFKGKEAAVVKENRKGYFDYYLETERPNGKTVSYESLNSNEKEEYNELTGSSFVDFSKSEDIYEIILLNNGNKVIYRNVKLANIEGLSKNKNTYSIELNLKNLINAENKDEIAFDLIAMAGQVPIYPGCENAEDQKTCFMQKVSAHIAANFDIKIGSNLGLTKGTKKTYVQFKIDKTGAIVDIKSRGPHEDLEEEALRVITSLPQMIPGEYNDKKVGVKYTLPITFVID